MKRLQNIWDRMLRHYRIFPLVVLCLFAAISALILVRRPCRPVMLCVEGLLFIIAVAIVIGIVLMFATTFGVYHRNKDISHCLASLGLDVLVVIIGLGMQILAGISNPDPYAYLHPIPEGLNYEIPVMEDLENNVCNMRHDAVIEADSATWLQLSSSYSGSYNYTFYYHSLPQGNIYLRCFEAGTNSPLSTDEIEQRTMSPAYSDGAFCCQVSDKHFTIYEGIPMEYYVARIEVWYRSADTKEERKLMEKYYRVDGYEH
ncbi:MAG: hypothetical protein E7074_02070 [Bacteroidales bacterium]|jgi:hypothetical protein|nr:hypothetical protein [Bacteroidales bacterium]